MCNWYVWDFQLKLFYKIKANFLGFVEFGNISVINFKKQPT